MADTAEWQSLWESASRARAEGRISQALRLYAMAVADSPSGDPSVEAADLVVELTGELAGVAQLYAEHCERMGLPDDGCPSRAVHERFVRDASLSAAAHLLRSVQAHPGVARSHRVLSEALERAGRLDMALLHRQRANRLEPDSHHDAIAIGRLLAAQGRFGEAAAHYRALAAGSPFDPEIRAHLVRACALEGSAQAQSAGAYGALLRAWSGHGGDAQRGADYLAVLAWTVASFPQQEIPDGLHRAIVAAANPMVEDLANYGPAHLAKGYASLCVGNVEDARNCFSTASHLCKRSDGIARSPTPFNGQVESALAFARRFLLDGSGETRHNGRAPPIDDNLLELAHAKAVRRTEDAYDALQMCDAAVSGYVVRDIPLSYERHRTYKIVAHAGLYYAIPGHVREFTIIDGVVWSRSSVADHARFRVPRSVVDTIPRIVRRGGRASRPVLRLLRKIRLWLYAVPGVKVADSIEALIAEIDKSFAPTATAVPAAAAS